jgi:CheY-like chemotaxis protein
MATRRVLLIDTDSTFHELLARLLAPYAIGVYPVSDGSDGLRMVAEIDPELLFISVELPDKAGYAICNKAKRNVARNIPVVLATASVPPSDLQQHRKIKTHADAYIDKRADSPETILRKIDELINLGPPVEDVPVEFEGELNVEAEDIHFDDEPASVRYVGASPPPPVPSHAEVDPGIDAETEAVFAGLVDENEETSAPVEQEGTEPSEGFEEAQATGVRTAPSFDDGEASPDMTAQEGLDLTMMEGAAEATGRGAELDGDTRLAEYEEEIERLRAELEEARRAPAQPTQFSREREFLNLREVINRKEKEILDLREEVDTKDRAILGGRDKIRELDRKVRDSDEKLLNIEGSLVTANESLAALKLDKEKAAEREKGLKGRIELAQAQLRKADEEFENLKKRSAAEVASLSGELAAKKRELDAARKEAAERLAALEAQHEAALKKAESDRVVALAARERALGDERDAQLAALRADMGDKLERTRQDSAAALAAAAKEKKDALEAAARDKAAALEAAARDKKEALEAAARDKAAALDAAEEVRVKDLHDAEQRRAARRRGPPAARARGGRGQGAARTRGARGHQERRAGAGARGRARRGDRRRGAPGLRARRARRPAQGGARRRRGAPRARARRRRGAAHEGAARRRRQAARGSRRRRGEAQGRDHRARGSPHPRAGGPQARARRGAVVDPRRPAADGAGAARRDRAARGRDPRARRGDRRAGQDPRRPRGAHRRLQGRHRPPRARGAGPPGAAPPRLPEDQVRRGHRQQGQEGHGHRPHVARW